MAKRPERKIVDDNLFSRTAPEPVAGSREQQPFDLNEGPTVSKGVGLTTGELKAIDAIAGELRITRNGLLRWAIRYVIREYWAGRLDINKYLEIPPEPKRNIRMP